MNKLNVFDLDQTLIDTSQAVIDCQAKGIARATGEDISELEEELRKDGLEPALEKRKIRTGHFFRTHYETFNPYEELRNSRIKLFPDTERTLLEINGTNAIISNSGIEVTKAKLDAFGISDFFEHVYAEFLPGKAKPAEYMAEMLAEDMTSMPDLILNIGDQEKDMEFGKALAHVFNPGEVINILVDREGRYKGRKNYDIKIASLDEIKKYG